ncbi:MAG: hypothetical protein Q9O24_06820 [Gammaproteobacteria bacterium]|nr:hypothetical protein [Gammaproteobacteria bacterium]
MKNTRCEASDSQALRENSLLVKSAIEDFEEKMVAKFVDEMALVYIIGAFSAGKSRLVRELLRSYNLAHLLPISSQDRQSALPLEITYSDKACLKQIDIKNTTEVELKEYPSRQAQKNYDSQRHCLRLEVPESALSLGDVSLISAEEGLKRLVMKDMPGWNSGDSFVSENPLTSGLVHDNNLSLVYVVRANGVDGQDDVDRLKAVFVAAEEGEAYFYNNVNVVVVVTRCDDVAEFEGIRTRVTEKMDRLVKEAELEDEFNLTVLCVDFGKESEKRDHSVFIADFWQAILKPIEADNGSSRGASASLAKQVAHWKPEWDIRSKLASSLQLLRAAKTSIEGFKKEGEFILHLNSTRLMGLSVEQKRKKIAVAWKKQAGEWQHSSEAVKSLTLAKDHPLALWWNEHYWLRGLSLKLQKVDRLFAKMEETVAAFPEKEVELQGFFTDKMEIAYVEARRSLFSSFYWVGEALENRLKGEGQDKVVATLLSLSIIDAKYSDYRNLFDVVEGKK